MRSQLKEQNEFGGARLVELDATRGLAALLVFFGHANAVYSALHGITNFRIVSRIFAHLFDGAAAVDYFFVLSGFVLSLPYLEGKRKPIIVSRFVLRRVLRIMPTYWAGLAVAVLLRAITMPYVHAALPGFIEWGQPLPWHDILSHVGLIFGPTNSVLIDGPIWSLVVEMQISLLLPMVIATLHPRQSVAGSATLLIISIFIAIGFTSQSALLFLPLFVFGALLARYQSALIDFLRGLPGSIQYVVIFIACLMFWNRSIQSRWGFPDPRQEWITGIASGVFLLSVLAGIFPALLLRSGLSQFLGRISYSLYLIHLPILYAVTVLLQASSVTESLIFPTAFALALAGAAVLHYLVESPSMTFARWFVRNMDNAHKSTRVMRI